MCGTMDNKAPKNQAGYRCCSGNCGAHRHADENAAVTPRYAVSTAGPTPPGHTRDYGGELPQRDPHDVLGATEPEQADLTSYSPRSLQARSPAASR